MTLAKGVTTWRVVGVSNEKALRLRDEQEGARTGPGRYLERGLNCGPEGSNTVTFTRCGANRSACQPTQDKPWLLETCLRVMENPKQEMPCGRLKAEVRPLVSLPTAKPLSWFFTRPQECRSLTGETALHLRTSRPGRAGRVELRLPSQTSWS